MKPRDVLLGTAASAVAPGAAAQELPKTAHIGFIATSEVFQPRYFLEVLRRLGLAAPSATLP